MLHSNIIGSFTVLKPLYLMLHKMSSCVFVRMGCGRRTILQLVSSGVRMPVPTRPIYSLSDITRFSLIESMAGFVT